MWVAREDHAEMPASGRGLIDMREFRDWVANILKSSKQAFLQRKGRYGYDQC